MQSASIQALAPAIVGRDLEGVLADMSGFWRELVHDSQLRWLGPEKGVMQMAVGAVVNAVWDLEARREGEPLWKLLADLSPEEVVDLVDFRYLTDALTGEDALEILTAAVDGREEREAELLEDGCPAYTTIPGWLGYSDEKMLRLGYSDEKMLRLAHEAVADGYPQIKLKVGADVDIRRMALAREAVGPDVRIAVDANQRWDVADAIDWVRKLAPYDPWWVEEPTSPDDILGHTAIAAGIAPVKVATGEHVQNRIVFNQLLQAKGTTIVQIDATRVAGVNENIAILLLVAKFDVPVCPHAGGVGRCELAQHLSMFDHLAVSATKQDRVIEFVDHLHEHFADPAVVERGHFRTPRRPGTGAQVLPATLETFRYPGGAERVGRGATGTTARVASGGSAPDAGRAS